jgi:hypothetical protein
MFINRMFILGVLMLSAESTTLINADQVVDEQVEFVLDQSFGHKDVMLKLFDNFEECCAPDPWSHE